MLACWRVTPAFSRGQQRRFACRAEDTQTLLSSLQNRKKILVVGSGWAGLGAANHLCKQGFDVTVLEGGYNNGLNRIPCSPDDFGVRGFWYPYRNIFNIVEELDIKPFTNWTKSAQYSGGGLEVQFPIFQDLPQWPTPFGTLLYTEFVRLPLVDQLSSLPLMTAVVDFDNTDAAWRKYDTITARELFRQFGCSERLYQEVFNPLLQVGLFAPAEQCSAAVTLGMLYYFVLAHQAKQYPDFVSVYSNYSDYGDFRTKYRISMGLQFHHFVTLTKDFDLVLCRGKVKEKIFEPWMDYMRNQGCKFLEGRRVTDIFLNEETGCITQVICGKESFKADAVILATGISALQEIVLNSAALCMREEFLKVLNLSTVDLVTVKLHLDRKVDIPNASNACSGFGNSKGWTFFDLNSIHDEHKEDPVTVVQADFFQANELLPLKDEDVTAKVMSYLSRCIKEFENAAVVEKEIGRFPKSLTHFFPGSYKYFMRGSTSFPNLFMAGDWIITRHGSWSQEKSFVTGLEAANRVVDYLGEGSFARIIPVEEDEAHIQALRNLNRNLNEIRSQLPWSSYFIQ